jgi:basic amino acid/polyamine antiporter, APA family
MSLWRTKSVEQSIADTDETDHRLRKDLTALDLTVFGVGVTIGAGIFILTGRVAATNAGPAIAISFILAAVACGLAALCYAEFASTIPVAGSAYTFSYATFGELLAWIIGWDLALEFVVGAAAVAAGWSSYLAQVLEGTAFELPTSITSVEQGAINLPAGLLVLALMAILIIGVKLSSRVNLIAVIIKVGIVLFVIVAGLFYIERDNYSPFIPPSQPAPEAEGGFLDIPLIESLFGLEPAVFGWGGIVAGAAVVFFAFIGFDVVATTAEETRNPQRDVPIGILGALSICTVLYVTVSLVVTGMQSYTDIDPTDAAPLATAFAAVGRPGFADLISAGAIVGLVVVVMILLLGQSRVIFAMSRDGLLPTGLARVHPKFGTPYVITTIVGISVALIASFTSIGSLAELVNVGTLFAFILVSIGVIVLRRTRPDLPRAFRVPMVPAVPILAALACFYLMLNLTGTTWVRFFVWMAIGVIVYAAYGRSHSRLSQAPRTRTPSEAAPQVP